MRSFENPIPRHIKLNAQTSLHPDQFVFEANKPTGSFISLPCIPSSQTLEIMILTQAFNIYLMKVVVLSVLDIGLPHREILGLMSRGTSLWCSAQIRLAIFPRVVCSVALCLKFNK